MTKLTELIKSSLSARMVLSNQYYSGPDLGMSRQPMSLNRRLSRLEQTSFLGSQAELDECEFLFMRVPAGYQTDPQFEKSKALASKLEKHLFCLDTPASHSLPLWALEPLDRLSDELLDEQLNELERRIAAMQVSESQPCNTRSI